MKKTGAGVGFLTVGMAALDAYNNVKEGDSVPVGIAKAAATNALYLAFPELLPIQIGASLLPVVANGVNNFVGSRIYTLNTVANRGSLGGNYIDTQAAATMRQQAVKAIQESNFNARLALGNEARMYARG
ncbi:hypothetical protein MTATph1_CDS0252 [Moorella phage MTATph1]